MKNKVMTLLWTVGILAVFLGGTSYVGEAATTTYAINQSPSVTFIDSSGAYLRGPAVNMTNAIPFAYTGTDIKQDITTQQTTTSEQEAFISDETIYPSGTTVRVKNAGFYKGKPMTFVIKPVGMISFTLTTENNTLRPVAGYNTAFASFDISAEDSEGKAIVDPNIKFILPLTQGNSSLQSAGGNTFNLWYSVSPTGINNIIVVDDDSASIS